MGIFRRRSKHSTSEIPAICNVNLERYLGTWYEIARLPHSFEKGLDNVTATYNLKTDGNIEVVNAGMKNGEKKAAKATAWIPDKNCTGKLLVSFFRPFKSEYNIIKLNEDYSFAIVTSSSKNYLWILSREPRISEELYNDLISFAASKGFDTSKIIKVNQSDIRRQPCEKTNAEHQKR
ncbi:lipocalin family protein [Parasporobacterium paucivorans]|uniref:Apolipoprotein D and lipocalin family protein n=1 Tax=Parasporobacterium paucivorans DSM 15970 TaxID=1122934 RepID=A0A1M6D176_9FIRM|nr:lipocalin family protein [Parasporobacterium paucivorans]SHI66814.1 apolipoprotein D and lipocalin family protein [Parasporobacterium paucivorans DSM 15970]